LLFIKVK